MRRRPVEDDQEQQESGQRHVAGDRGPADHRRECTRRAADDDVRRRAALQHHRVDDDVEPDREQRQERGDEVDGPGHQADRDRAEHDPEDDRALGRHRACRQRPAAGAGHELVDVALEVLVDRVRGAGRERAADERPERQARPVDDRHAGDLAGRQDHRGDGRDEQQLDDPRLRQRHVGANRFSGRLAPARRPRRTRRRRGLACARGGSDDSRLVVRRGGERDRAAPHQRAECRRGGSASMARGA